MRSAAAAQFLPWSERWEGPRLSWMYLDIYGLITCGTGNLIDPIALALALEWRKGDGTIATRQEVTDEWHRVKAHAAHVLDPDGHTKHWTHPPPNPLSGGGAFKAGAILHLDRAEIDRMVANRLSLNEAHLRDRFPGFDSWPAAAQLALHFFAWAAGPGLDFVSTKVLDGVYPKFAAFLYAGDFAGAVSECWIAADTRAPTGLRIPNPKNPGLWPRNLAIVALLEEAAHVVAMGLDPDVLYYPSTPAGAETSPGLGDEPNEVTIIGGAVLHPDTIDAAVEDAQKDPTE